MIVEDHSTIAHNNSDSDGGGIYVTEGELVVSNSTIAANDAEYDGGGIYGNRNLIAIEDQSTVTENETENGRGGGIASYGEYDAGPECDEVLGELTVIQSTISDNKAAVEDEGDGGGIYVETYYGCDQRQARGLSARRSIAHHGTPAVAELLSEEGGLTVEQSAITGNEAGYFGGGIDESGGEDPIINSTIADNTAGYDGGGVYAREDVAALISDTVAYNKGDEHIGNNLAAEDLGAIYLRNTIVAEEAGEFEENCEGEIESLDPDAGYNLDYPSKAIFDNPSDSCGMSEADHDLVGQNPEFSTEGLHENGGPTKTIALVASSPAIGVVPLAGDCEEAEEGPHLVDQRGVTRPGIPGKGCDIGAYEYQEAPQVAAPKKEEPKKEAAASVLSIKVVSAPPMCASKRDITIHIQNVKQLGIVSAVVSIDGRHKRTLSGRHLRTGIDLVGLPKGTFTIEIVAHTRSGHTLKGERVYHTCHTKLPGHSYLKL